MSEPEPDGFAPRASGPDADSEEAALWAAFSGAATDAAAASAWVALQARRLPVRTCAVIGASGTGETLEIVAVWPDHATVPAELSLSAREALTQGIPLVRSSPRGFHLAYALEGVPGWVAVAEVSAMPAPALLTALHALRWGAGWLVASRATRALEALRTRADRMETAARLAEEVSAQRDARGAAAALGAGLARAFRATYVAVALLRRGVLSEPFEWTAAGNLDPVPEPHIAADFLLRALEAGEPVHIQGKVAVDRGDEPAPDVAPERSSENGEAVRPAGEGAHGTPVPAACGLALPVLGAEAVVGAIYLQRGADAPWSEQDVVALREIGQRIALPLEAKPLARIAPVTRERRLFVALFGPVRLRLKLAIVSVLAATLVALGATGRYEVTAEGVIEGSAPLRVQVPFAGTLSEVYVRRGDAVRRGQVVARMDDTPLLVERTRLASERDRLLVLLRDVATGEEPATVDGLQARVAQLETALSQVEARIRQARVASPADGIIVSDAGAGRVNATMAGEELLVEVAPTQSYRVVLWVDEQALPEVREGQSGSLAVADAREPVAFTVTRLGGAVLPREGGRQARVEAEIEGGIGEAIRPGAGGLARIDAGNRKLLWIWWRRFEATVREWRQ